MHALRLFIARSSRLALLALLAAFALKALLPAGFMLSATPGQNLAITVCSGLTGHVDGRLVSIPLRRDRPGEHSDHPKPDGQCAFSSLAKAASDGDGPMLLAFALAFALLLVLGLQLPRPSRAKIRLLPPLRGPPLAA